VVAGSNPAVPTTFGDNEECVTFLIEVLYKLSITIYNSNQYQEALNSPQKNLSKVNSLDIILILRGVNFSLEKTSPR